MTRWQPIATVTGPRSMTVLGVLVALGLVWLGWPVWDSLTSPSRAQARAEAPWMLLALIGGLAGLGAAMYLDAGRRIDALAPVAALVVANTMVRVLLNPAAAGVEFVHALPLIAGIGLGAPAGFLVGAASAISSTIVIGTPASTLPAQALIWGLSGTLGGLLWRLRPRTAWLAGLGLAPLAGLGSGLLLNLMGWAQEPGGSLTSFYPGLPPGEVVARLWDYTRATSIAYDLTRGVTTMIIIAVIGRPVIAALRPPDPGSSSDPDPISDPSPEPEPEPEPAPVTEGETR